MRIVKLDEARKQNILADTAETGPKSVRQYAERCRRSWMM